MRDSLIFSAMWIQPQVSPGVTWTLVYRDITTYSVGKTIGVSTEFMICISFNKMLDESLEENLQLPLKERT